MRVRQNSSRLLHLDELLSSEKLVVRRSEIHRWGVFAREPIKKYEILEEFPYFKVPIDELNNSNSCMNYSYALDKNFSIIGMGFCGLYNHSFEPNVDYEIDKVNEVMRHYAICDIDVDEELTLDYGEENASCFTEVK
jgi:SET domain-containing protein